MNFKLACQVVLTGLVLAAVISFPKCSMAGLLDDFEHEATKPAPENRHHAQDDDDDEDFVGSCIGVFFSDMVQSTVDAVTDDLHEQAVAVRPPESPGMSHRPMIRFDYGYQDVETDVSAHDFRLEFGLHQFGLQARTTHYRESSPKDALDITEAHFLYRIAGGFLDFDLGVGVLNLEGNESHSGPSFTLPLALHVHEFLDFEFRPSWGFIENNDIGDYDLGVSWGWPYVAVRAGYRWMLVGSQSLNGPYLGLSLRY